MRSHKIIHSSRQPSDRLSIKTQHEYRLPTFRCVVDGDFCCWSCRLRQCQKRDPSRFWYFHNFLKFIYIKCISNKKLNYNDRSPSMSCSHNVPGQTASPKSNTRPPPKFASAGPSPQQRHSAASTNSSHKHHLQVGGNQHQRRAFKVGDVWENLGVRQTARASEFWIYCKRWIW